MMNPEHEALAQGKPRLFERTYFLTPAECNPQQRMPLTLLINRIIEVATLHANELGIGYADLVGYNQTWVLSRVAVEMTRYPGVNETYRVETWVATVNRLFSERDFCFYDAEGNILGWARTVWAVLDTVTRGAGDISRMAWIEAVALPDRCPVPKAGRLRPLAEYVSAPYRFTYCDIDFNRHVNSSRYIELLLNQWSLDFHDRNRLTRFEIAYLHEAYYDEPVDVRLSQSPDSAGGIQQGPTYAELVNGDRALCRAALTFSPR